MELFTGLEATKVNFPATKKLYFDSRTHVNMKFSTTHKVLLDSHNEHEELTWLNLAEIEGG